MRTPFGQLAYVRDGMVIRLDAFADHASALAAAAELERPTDTSAYAMLRQDARPFH